MNNSILILGKIPPPIGGVTIHVYRLLEHLDTYDINYSFFDLNNFSLIFFIFNIKKNKIAHLHTSSPLLRFLFTVICKLFFTKSIITIHGNLNRYDFFKNLLDKLSIKFASIPIVINRYSYEISSKINPNTKYISAYLPPILIEKLPDKIVQLLHYCKNNFSYIISTNAFARRFDKDKNEIYGIEFLINYFSNLPDYILLISDPSKEYSTYYNNQFSNKFDNIKFITVPHQFFGILRECDIYIRNTSTDGDSLSIHEALHLDIPVLATDVVDRPNGVLLIRRNDSLSLSCALQNITYLQKNNKKSHNYNGLIDFYKDLKIGN
jgi:hypothetical protein